MVLYDNERIQAYAGRKQVFYRYLFTIALRLK